ncbi:MAG: hypothetical protein A4E53_04021 [Pelotomaculum sp. PtaB.Bin104]|nr:MAG: hypothetical protein A4E53_04021 [Pelotomaculum sp. PtaB.Bin104]
MNKKIINYVIIPTLLIAAYTISIKVTTENIFFTVIGWGIFGLGLYNLAVGKYSKGILAALIGLILVYQF